MARQPDMIADNGQPPEVKNMQVRVGFDGFKAVKILALEEGKSLEDLMVEALNDLLVKYNKPPVVERRSPDRPAPNRLAMRDRL